MNKLVYPKMTVVNELSFADFTGVRSLLEMGALVSAQTLDPREALSAHIAAVRLLSRVNPCVPYKMTFI